MGSVIDMVKRCGELQRGPRPARADLEVSDATYGWDGSSLSVLSYPGQVLFPTSSLGLAELLLWLAAAELRPTDAEAMAFDDLVLSTLKGPFLMQRSGIRNFLECWRRA